MQKADIVSSSVLLAFSTWLMTTGIEQSTFGSSLYGLSPKGVPFAMAAGVAIFSAIQLITSLLAMRKGPSSDSPKKATISNTHWIFLGIMAVTMTVTLTLMNYLGFIVSGIIFLIAIQFLAGQRKPLPLILVAVITPIILDRAIWYGMGVMLPSGVFF
jgi:hypothetical protein